MEKIFEKIINGFVTYFGLIKTICIGLFLSILFVIGKSGLRLLAHEKTIGEIKIETKTIKQTLENQQQLLTNNKNEMVEVKAILNNLVYDVRAINTAIINNSFNK